MMVLAVPKVMVLEMRKWGSGILNKIIIFIFYYYIYYNIYNNKLVVLKKFEMQMSKVGNWETGKLDGSKFSEK
jgi:hypothetical protein